MENSENLMWEEISTEHVIQDEWIDMRRSYFRFPDGSTYGPYYSYTRKDYVIIVAIDAEGSLLCVRQYRQGVGKVTTEFPAGGMEREDGENGESTLSTAKRELVEETGYESDDWTFLIKVPANPTISDNYCTVYLAQNCKKKGEQHLDETEFMNVERYKPEELEMRISSGQFEQPDHIMAWLLACRKIRINADDGKDND